MRFSHVRPAAHAQSDTNLRSPRQA